MDDQHCADCGKEITDQTSCLCIVDWCPNTLCKNCAFIYNNTCPEHRQNKQKKLRVTFNKQAEKGLDA